jgi:hypothetical protein
MGNPRGGTGNAGVSTSASGNGSASAGASGAAATGGTGAGSGGAAGGQPAGNGGVLESAGTSNDAGAAGSPEEECGEYLACGCGCCGGVSPSHACYYPDRGETIASIKAEDEAQAEDPSCAAAGCALGTEYLCCVPPADVEAATYTLNATISAVDRLAILRADPNDHCTIFSISSTLEPPRFPIEVPEGWKIDGGANGFYCAEAYNFPSQRVAIGGEGFLAFSAPDRCAIDFDFTLFFDLGTEVQATRFVGQGVPVPNLGVGCN